MTPEEKYDPSEPMTCLKKTLIAEIVRLESRCCDLTRYNEADAITGERHE